MVSRNEVDDALYICGRRAGYRSVKHWTVRMRMVQQEQRRYNIFEMIHIPRIDRPWPGAFDRIHKDLSVRQQRCADRRFQIQNGLETQGVSDRLSTQEFQFRR